MSPVPTATHPSTRRLLYSLFSVAAQYVPRIVRLATGHTPPDAASSPLVKREQFDPHSSADIAFAVLIPVLVLSSGLFAGLTLGYMSLDETQLNVLSISGTPKQREYANKIKPIRKNGHLLLVTLLLANMITNETLPIVADPILGGGVQSVVVSTVLIVIFAEIIPQSVCTRHGLYLGAKMAGFTKFLIYLLGIFAWPVAKILELALGPHHGIIYRRAELKELIAMHSSLATHGGDLKTDTVTIIGATLDLQEKVVRQAMTPIADVFMLSIDANLDYDLLKQICLTGHSRVPVYEEIELNGSRVKKILGILLVKQCVLLDPKDAIPLRKIPLNKVPFIPNDEPLLGLLDKFQEGRSHMAIAASVKHAVKRGFAQRLRERVGMGDSDSSDEEEKEKEKTEKRRRGMGMKKKMKDIEEGASEDTSEGDTLGSSNEFEKAAEARRERIEQLQADNAPKSRRTSFQIPKAAASISALEQSMPADAVLGKEGVADFLQNFDPAVMPLGIITLEDVLEELIGEEIYDEFDAQGAHGDPYVPHPPAEPTPVVPPAPAPSATNTSTLKATPVLRPLSLKGLSFLRSRSAPPTPRDATAAANAAIPAVAKESPAALPSVDAADTETPSTATAISLAGAGGVNLPEVVIERDTPSPTPTDPGDPQPPLQLQKPTPVLAGALLPAVTNVASRSASPAPSLEAILLDRKQRRLGAAATAPPGLISSASASAVASTQSLATPGPARVPVVSLPKGTMFKSSPLGGGERAGMVVAEQVKVKEEGRIPSEKDKEGPDIA
ncbi:CNNM transmembrane domain-containing protein [Mycena kentingensis (nom. inval.)]|nr:CNNM transmembrane domain-containing protein [Mycena kentingensis (nom. inval.)]